MIRNLIAYIVIFSVMQLASVFLFAMIPILIILIVVSWIVLIKKNYEAFDRLFLIILLSSNISPFVTPSGEVTFYTVHTIEILSISALYFYTFGSALISLTIQKRSYQIYSFILVLMIIGLLGGIVNASADELYFIREFMILSTYILAFIIWYPRESMRLGAIRAVLPIMILARIVSAAVMSGLLGHYSITLGIIIFHNPAVPIMLLLAYTLSNNFRYLAFFSLVLCVAILLLNFQKGFLVQYLFVLICFILFSKTNMRRVVPLTILLIVVLVPVVSQFKNLPTLDRIYYELRSFQSVSDGLSPRAVELKNIIVRANEEIPLAIAGGGLGSYFKEDPYKFRSWQRNTSAFTQGELDTGNFYKPHTTFAWLLLKFGILGIIVVMVFYIRTIYKLYRSKQLEVVSATVLAYTFWVLMQNSTVAIFSVIIFLAFTDTSRNEHSA